MEWALVVRRSYGIPDDERDDEARRRLVGFAEEQLRASGWVDATRSVAGPVVEALLALGDRADGDGLVAVVAATDGPDPAAAHRLIDEGVRILDPEHLVFDPDGDYPAEVLAAVERFVDRVRVYLREHPGAT